MTTERPGREIRYSPLLRLALAALDILTGVTEASVEAGLTRRGTTKWTFNVKPITASLTLKNVQDD